MAASSFAVCRQSSWQQCLTPVNRPLAEKSSSTLKALCGMGRYAGNSTNINNVVELTTHHVRGASPTDTRLFHVSKEFSDKNNGENAQQSHMVL